MRRCGDAEMRRCGGAERRSALASFKESDPLDRGDRAQSRKVAAEASVRGGGVRWLDGAAVQPSLPAEADRSRPPVHGAPSTARRSRAQGSRAQRSRNARNTCESHPGSPIVDGRSGQPTPDRTHRYRPTSDPDPRRPSRHSRRSPRIAYGAYRRARGSTGVAAHPATSRPSTTGRGRELLDKPRGPSLTRTGHFCHHPFQ
jgi:hypothetical protein